MGCSKLPISEIHPPDDERSDLLVRHARLTHPRADTDADAVDEPASTHAAPPCYSTARTTRTRLCNNDLDEGPPISGVTDLAHNLDATCQLPLPEIAASSQPQSYDDFVPTAMGLPMPTAVPFDHGIDRLSAPLILESTTELSSTIALDFLWSNEYGFNEFLPAAFFNTDYSLTQLSENCADMRQVNDTTLQSPAGSSSLPMPQTAFISSNSTPFISGNPVNGSHPIEWPLDPDLHSVNEADVVCPWRISTFAYEQLQSALLPYRKLLSTGFSFPTRYTLSRFIEGYFRGFHEHLPFLHVPTVSPATMAPELLLAIASVGALYKFEHAKG